MSVFRIQANVPEVFVNGSRDFQLFCRLYDCIFDGVKVDIDSMLETLDANSCSNVLLQLLQSKVGFFTNHKFTSDDLRVVIGAFPTIIKNKGSRKGIFQAVNTFLKVNKLKTGAYINIINNPKEESDGDSPYIINVGIEADILNTTLLDTLFYYILPTGHDIYYYFYTGVPSATKLNVSTDEYKLVYSNQYISNSIEVEPDIKYVADLPTDLSEADVGKIYVVSDPDDPSTLTKWYLDYIDNEYVWKEILSEDYRNVAMVGVSEISRFYPMSDTGNPDVYPSIHIDPETYKKADSVCGYYYNGAFYSDYEHHYPITPIGESNKLCYYDVVNRNFYIYTSSFNTPTETAPKFVLIVHEENVDNAKDES